MDVWAILAIGCCVLGILLGALSVLAHLYAGRSKPEVFHYPSEDQISKWA
jgi:hypothetical protein